MVSQLICAIDYFRDMILNDLGESYCWVSGGAVRDFFLYGGVLKETDIDIFFHDQNNYDIAKNYFEETCRNGGVYELVYENDNARRYKHKDTEYQFELIKRFYPDPKRTINSFDFTVCCCAIDRSGIYYHETYFIDLAGKNIVLHNVQSSPGTLSRIQKYIEKGFRINNDQIVNLYDQIRNDIANSNSYNNAEQTPSTDVITFTQATNPNRRSRVLPTTASSPPPPSPETRSSSRRPRHVSVLERLTRESTNIPSATHRGDPGLTGPQGTEYRGEDISEETRAAINNAAEQVDNSLNERYSFDDMVNEVLGIDSRNESNEVLGEEAVEEVQVANRLRSALSQPRTRHA